MKKLLPDYIRKKHGWTGWVLQWYHKDGSIRWLESNASALLNSNGKLFGFRGVDRDITGRKRIEEALSESEERFRNLVETTSDWIWETDVKGKYIYSSPKVKDLLGYEPEEVIGRTPYDLMPDEEAKRVSVIAGKIMKSHKPIIRLENKNIHKDGRFVLLETSGIPVFDSSGKFHGYRGIDRDITERKQAEETVSRALEEKEGLLRELQHRVKNSFAIITGIVGLETNRQQDLRMQKVLMDIRNRISSLSELYDLLYQNQEVKNIKLNQYLERLSRSIIEVYSAEKKWIKLQMHMDEIEIDVKRAVSIGLILNELLTNALKHAFPEKRRGTIRIKLNKSKTGIVLVVADEGIGLPQKIKFDGQSGLGLDLVKLLTSQLDGKIDLKREDGTVFSVKFPQKSKE